MLKSLEAIEQVKKGNRNILRENKWLTYLFITKENRINLEKVESVEGVSKNPVLDYVEKTLRILNNLEISDDKKRLIENVLIWSEVAKCGSVSQRKKWMEDGINLFVHNIGSAEIYEKEMPENTEETRLIRALIYTHGLTGQYLRGESLLKNNRPIYQWIIGNAMYTKLEVREFLYYLNQCVIGAVSEELWLKLESDILSVIDMILNGEFHSQDSLKERIRKLRETSIKNGENFNDEYSRIYFNEQVQFEMDWLLEDVDLWYVEAALSEFTLEEFTKIFLLIKRNVVFSSVKHIDFSSLMKEMHYDHNGTKKINLFKKRIFEKFLSEMSFADILESNIKENPHVSFVVNQKGQFGDTVFFNFVFSPPSQKLIEFCVESEKHGAMFEKAIILLYDFFELRRDQFDRFHNEDEYLNTMNQTVDLKKVILDYIVGEKVLDIGPGGGALLDEIIKKYPKLEAVGIDFSKNVVEALEKRIQKETLSWKVQYGNALDLEKDLSEKVDTIIFCSIIHELYSYIEFGGKKFNKDTIKQALQSAFNMLNDGGRIIIRDGIMTEPKDAKRIIRFRDSADIEFLKRYAKDFKGRDIQYEITGQNEVKMKVNDAMEFLYTYTWGEESYPHEVQEQFGYFTPSEFSAFIKESLGEDAHVLVNKHYLQEGYELALLQKIEFFDENYSATKLPDSTCLIVIEKKTK